MIQDQSHILVDNILYSCVDKTRRGNEQFVADHSLGYILSGETQIASPEGMKSFTKGTIGLVKRNQLVKSVKIPPPGGEFRAINIFFSQEILRRYSTERSIQINQKYSGPSYYLLPEDRFIKGFFESLLPYFDQPERMTSTLTELKTVEAIELLLKINPALDTLLFDFSEPYKIDLEAFMLLNYKFNVSLSDFARLSGRSKAGFKRDFEKIFKSSPGQWLQQKRLHEAYYLIKEKGIKPSAAYLDVGFENLSHFSFAFKNEFGVSPSMISQII